MYKEYSVLFHLPSIFIVESGTPAAAAMVDEVVKQGDRGQTLPEYC